MTVTFYLMPAVRNRKFYLVPGVRNYLVPNDSYEKYYLAVKGLTVMFLMGAFWGQYCFLNMADVSMITHKYGLDAHSYADDTQLHFHDKPNLCSFVVISSTVYRQN